MGLRPGPFLERVFFALRVFCSLWACGPSFSALQTLFFPGPAARAFCLKHFFSPSGRCSFLGLRPALFCPPGILPPAGNFLLAQKVPQKRLPPVALRGLGLTCAPLGAFLFRAHQQGPRGVGRNLRRVSSAV